jgi:hypothetical protein
MRTSIGLRAFSDSEARRSGGCAPLPLPERRAPLGIPCAVEAMATLPDDRGVRRRRIGGCRLGEAEVNTFRLLFVGATFLILPVEAQEHRFEDDPIMTCARTSSRVTCSPNCSASWRTHASCSPENVRRCAQEIVFDTLIARLVVQPPQCSAVRSPWSLLCWPGASCGNGIAADLVWSDNVPTGARAVTRTAEEYRLPARQSLNNADPSEYHLIDLATGLSCGGFKSLAAARQNAGKRA